mgnify:CR=1 FL=1
MRFRPCIDIHNGKVKQIVGGSLKDAGDQAKENFVAEQDAAFYAKLYKDGTLIISKKRFTINPNIVKSYTIDSYGKKPWRKECKLIKTVKIENLIKTDNIAFWFEDCTNLTTLIDFQNLDVSDCKDFFGLFLNCQSLIDIDSLKTWNVSNGKEFTSMFEYCKSLENIEALRNWDVSNGTNFSDMFCNCESLQDLNELENLNITNGTDFSSMFYNCTSLQNILLPDTLSILRKDIFYECNPTLKIHWKNHIYTYEDLLEYQTIY